MGHSGREANNAEGHDRLVVEFIVVVIASKPWWLYCTKLAI